MKPEYKNWMPKGMVGGFAAGAIGVIALCTVLGWLMPTGAAKTAVVALLAVLGAVLVGLSVWAVMMYRTFSYDGKRQLSKQIIETVAKRVTLPDGATGLDVGCGSGALINACAKRNPSASFVGVDHWGPEYQSFSQALCEQNALAEGVANVHFQKGDARKLDFPDETFDAVVSNYVYHNVLTTDRQALLLESLRVLKKGGTFAIHDIFSKAKYGDMQAFLKKLRAMGYEQADLVPTTNGNPITRWESVWMALSGSALLIGKK